MNKGRLLEFLHHTKCKHCISRHDNFIGCLSADKIKMSARKYFYFNIPVYKSIAEGSSYHEEYIQISALDDPEGLCRLFTTLYQREDECRAFYRILTAYVHAVLEKQLYKFHPLLTEAVRYFRYTVLEDISQGFPLVYCKFAAFLISSLAIIFTSRISIT